MILGSGEDQAKYKVPVFEEVNVDIDGRADGGQ